MSTAAKVHILKFKRSIASEFASIRHDVSLILLLQAFCIIAFLLGLTLLEVRSSWSWIPVLGSIVSGVWVLQDDQPKRRIAAMLAGFVCVGMSSAGLFPASDRGDTADAILETLVLTVIVYLALASASALSYTPMTFAMLSTAFSLLTVLTFWVVFFPWREFRVSYMVVMLYWMMSLVYQTQQVMEDIQNGTLDHIRSAMILSMAFTRLFVQVGLIVVAVGRFSRGRRLVLLRSA